MKNENTNTNTLVIKEKILDILTYGILCTISILVIILFDLTPTNISSNFLFANQAKAASSTLTLGITAGNFALTASSSVAFGDVSYSNTFQNVDNKALDTVNIEDARGSGLGWDIYVYGEDWHNADKSETLDFDGDGSGTGRLCMDITSVGSIEVVSGDATGISLGADACFTAASSSITLASAAASDGSGQYYLEDINLDQFIPAGATSTSYTLELFITVN